MSRFPQPRCLSFASLLVSSNALELHLPVQTFAASPSILDALAAGIVEGKIKGRGTVPRRWLVCTWDGAARALGGGVPSIA